MSYLRLLKFAQQLKELEELEPAFIESIRRERPIISSFLRHEIPAAGLSALAYYLGSKILPIEKTRQLAFIPPIIGGLLGLYRGIKRDIEISKILSDPFYRKYALYRQFHPEALSELAEQAGIPLQLLLWKKLIGI